MLLPVLASIAIGGLIGYATNWLAIKMLFRPLRAWHIGGWRVPFTPGLIPKQREKLATGIGDTVGEHLLTSETLFAAIDTPEFSAQLSSMVSRLWDSQADLTVYEILEQQGWWEEALLWEERLIAATVRLAERAEVQNALVNALEPLAWQLGESAVKALTVTDAEPSRLHQIIGAVRDSAELRYACKRWLNDCCLHLQSSEQQIGDVVPEGLQNSLRKLLVVAGPDIFSRVADNLEKPANREMLKNLLREFLASSTLLKLAAAFLDWDSLIESFLNSLREERVQERLISLLTDGLDSILNMEISALAAQAQPESLDRLADQLYDLVLGEYTVEKLMAGLEGLMQGDAQGALSEAAATVFLDESRGILRRWLRDGIVQALSSPQLGEQLGDMMRQVFAALHSQRLSQLVGNWEPTSGEAITTRLLDLLRRATRRYGGLIVQALNLPRMVEAQINRLDVAAVEGIVLGVMSDQLKGITRLGLLLGGLIGLFMPFINLWLMR